MNSQRLGLLRLYRNLDKILFSFSQSLSHGAGLGAFQLLCSRDSAQADSYLFLSYTNAFKVLTSNVWVA